MLFKDFNEAIKLASSKGFYSAWTNEAFELWYLLHFRYLYAAVSRAEYMSKLENEIRRCDGYKDFHYKKNDAGMYALLQSVGNENQAKRFAQKLRKSFEHSLDYKSHIPCTMVDLLVDELENTENVLSSLE